MPYIPLLASALAVLLLAPGCAPAWTIVRAPTGMTRQEGAHIPARCQASGPVAYPTDNLGVVYAQYRAQDSAFRMCLEAHGIETANK
jgi:hypothetical protein